MPFCLGNDVVALTAPRCRGRAGDTRFLNRVFAPEEQQAIAASPTPEKTLWLHWAAKESVFKSVTKALGRAPVFHHQRFRISFPPEILGAIGTTPSHPPSGTDGTLALKGTARFEGYSFQLRAEVREDFIHAVAWLPDGPDAPPLPPPFVAEVHAHEEGRKREKEEFRPKFSDPEWGCVSHAASALTRLGARRTLATVLCVEEGRLEIRCGPGASGRRVPLVFLDGTELPTELTLSHDAHLMAWAFIAPTLRASPLSEGMDRRR